MAAAGQAMVDDITGKVTGQVAAGEHIRLPEPPLGRQQRNGLHMGLDVDIVPLRQERIQAQSMAILEVHFINLIPDAGTQHLGAGDLPAPEVVEEIAAHGTGPGVTMFHQRRQPLRVEVAGTQFHLQRPFEGIDTRVLRVRVL